MEIIPGISNSENYCRGVIDQNTKMRDSVTIMEEIVPVRVSARCIRLPF